MKFCCGVTLYYPKEEELDFIREYKYIFEYIFIYDNTDNKDFSKKNKSFFEQEGFEYISHKNNEGLSVAFNVMCKKAIYNNFSYICLFDQDSVILKKDLIEFIDFVRIDSNKDVGIYVPKIIYKHNEKNIFITKDNINQNEIDWAISSGSLVNLLAYQKTEGFDENYFIDRLDYDYCHVLKKLGYKIIEVKKVFLYQTLGEQGKGIFSTISQHSPIRHYYIFRNRLYFYFKRNEISKIVFFKVILLSLKHIVEVIFLEKQKREKLKMIIYGAKDFYKNNMGKYTI